MGSEMCIRDRSGWENLIALSSRLYKTCSILLLSARTGIRSPVKSSSMPICFCWQVPSKEAAVAVSYTHLRAHETDSYLVCRLLLEKKKKTEPTKLGMISYDIFCLKKKTTQPGNIYHISHILKATKKAKINK